MRFVSTTCLAIAMAVTTWSAQGQDHYPSRPIRFVVCCLGYSEAVARTLATELQDHIKQAIVVETKPGANGILAAEYVAKQPADGYTVLIGTNSTHAANQSLYRKLPYDFLKDFAPISGISQGSLLLAVDARLAARNVAELTALARKAPGQLTFGAASSSSRAGMELYRSISGADITYIPYKTNPQVITDMLGGRIDMMLNDAGSLMPHVQSGKLRALAVSGVARAPALPDVPTMQEAGVPGYALTFWHGVWAPAGTPKEIVDTLAGYFHWALAQPKVRQQLADALCVPMPLSPSELFAFSVDEEKKWRKIVVSSGMQME